MHDKQSLFYFFGEKDEEDKYTWGWQIFLENHVEKLSAKQSDYINNKWIVIADGTTIIENNKYDNKAVVRNY